MQLEYGKSFGARNVPDKPFAVDTTLINHVFEEKRFKTGTALLRNAMQAHLLVDRSSVATLVIVGS